MKTIKRDIPSILPIMWSKSPDHVLVLPVDRDNEIFKERPVPDIDGSGLDRGTAVEVAVPRLNPIEGYTRNHTRQSNGKHVKANRPQTVKFWSPVKDGNGHQMVDLSGNPEVESFEVRYGGPYDIQELHREEDKEVIEQLMDCPYNGDHELCYEGNPYGYFPLFVVYDPKKHVEQTEAQINTTVTAFDLLGRLTSDAKENDLELLASLMGIDPIGVDGQHNAAKVKLFELATEDPYTITERLEMVREDQRITQLFRLGVWRHQFGHESGTIRAIAGTGYQVQAEDGTGEVTTYDLMAGNENEGALKLSQTNVAYEALVRTTGFSDSWDHIVGLLAPDTAKKTRGKAKKEPA